MEVDQEQDVEGTEKLVDSDEKKKIRLHTKNYYYYCYRKSCIHCSKYHSYTLFILK